MTLQVLGVMLLTFLLSLGFGKLLVPWLKEKEFIQPLKEEVERRIYAEEDDPAVESRYTE